MNDYNLIVSWSLIIFGILNLLFFIKNIEDRQAISEKQKEIERKENNRGNHEGVILQNYAKKLRKEIEAEYLRKKIDFLEKIKTVLKEKGWKASL
jgi:hypothetical protein